MVKAMVKAIGKIYTDQNGVRQTVLLVVAKGNASDKK